MNINGYDNQLYCFGKGQSATTVSSPDTAVPKGTPILIKGTVTDQSPGETCLGIPAAGTPAISDESMSAWMEYLYMQRPKPTDATGVSVVLTAYGPDGEPIDIGTTTTDANGKYGYTWNPPDEGTYHITASFEGSESYYRSEDTTYLTVGPASSSTNTDTDTDNGTAAVASIDSTVIVGVAVVAVIIAAIAVILAIRKR